MLSWSLFVRMHTGRNDWSCWSFMSTSHADFIPSVFLSFALPVENVWLIKIFQFLLIFFVPCSLFCKAFRCATDKNAFIPAFWDSSLCTANVCYCPFSNKYISCYLFINMRWCFSSNNFLKCCYISCTFCSYVSFFWMFSSLRQSILDIYLYQIRTGRADTRRNILQQIKSI
jgi:hypothetical protein